MKKKKKPQKKTKTKTIEIKDRAMKTHKDTARNKKNLHEKSEKEYSLISTHHGGLLIQI